MAQRARRLTLASNINGLVSMVLAWFRGARSNRVVDDSYWSQQHRKCCMFLSKKTSKFQSELQPEKLQLHYYIFQSPDLISSSSYSYSSSSSLGAKCASLRLAGGHGFAMAICVQNSLNTQTIQRNKLCRFAMAKSSTAPPQQSSNAVCSQCVCSLSAFMWANSKTAVCELRGPSGKSPVRACVSACRFKLCVRVSCFVYVCVCASSSLRPHSGLCVAIGKPVAAAAVVTRKT